MSTDRIPVTNRTAMPLFVAGVMIPAGETKLFPAHHVPDNLRDTAPQEAEVEATDDPIQELLAMKIPEIVAALPQMSPEDYAAVKEAENAFGNPRKGLRKAFAEEDLRRANEQASAQTGETETQGTDSDNVNKTTGAADDEPTNSANAG